jgi:hypothetical protein
MHVSPMFPVDSISPFVVQLFFPLESWYLLYSWIVKLCLDHVQSRDIPQTNMESVA